MSDSKKDVSPGLVHGLMGLRSVLMGLGILAGTVVSQEVSAPIFVLLRLVFAIPVLAVLRYFRAKQLGKELKGLPIKAHLQFSALAVLGVTGNQVLGFLGASLSSASLFALFLPVVPVVVSVVEVARGNEKMHWMKLTGLLSIVVGTLVAAGVQDMSFGFGAILILLSSLCFAGYMLCATPIMARFKREGCDSLTATLWLMVHAVPQVAAFVMYDSGSVSNVIEAVSGMSALHWVLSAICGGLVVTYGYVIVPFASKRLGAITAAWILLILVVTMISESVLYSSIPTIAELIGATLILAGLGFMVTRKITETREAKARASSVLPSRPSSPVGFRCEKESLSLPALMGLGSFPDDSEDAAAIAKTKEVLAASLDRRNSKPAVPTSSPPPAYAAASSAPLPMGETGSEEGYMMGSVASGAIPLPSRPESGSEFSSCSSSDFDHSSFMV